MTKYVLFKMLEKIKNPYGIGYIDDKRFVKIGHKIKISLKKVNILRESEVFMDAGIFQKEMIKLNSTVKMW